MKKEIKALVRLAKMNKKGERYITVQGDEYTASAKGIDVTYKIPTQYVGMGEISFRVDASEMAKVASFSGGDTMRIEAQSDDRVRINDVSVFWSACTTARLTHAPEEPLMRIPLTAEFLDVVSRFAKCVSDDEIRPALTYICVEENAVAATDSFVLRFEEMTTGVTKGERLLFSPILLTFLDDSFGEIRVYGGYCAADNGTCRVYFSREDYRYPKWRAIVPDISNAKFFDNVTVSGEALADALKQAKKRKLQYCRVIHASSAVGVQFLENLDDGDYFNVSLPASAGNAHSEVLLRVDKLLQVADEFNGNTVLRLGADCRACMVNDHAIVMPVAHKDILLDDFMPETIALK